jgi:hypothetical protein
MLTLTKSHTLENLEWQFLSEKLQASETLAKIVLTAWQMGLWLAKILVEQQLAERAHQSTSLGNCAKCGSRLQSKGFVNRRMLTLVGWVQWRRRVGRCPNRCAGSHNTPFDAQLGIAPYQQTSTELMRLGCLLAVLMPFESATWVLQQVSGIRLSKDTLWQWVQTFGQQSMRQLERQLQQLVDGVEPMLEPLDSTALTLPLIIAADGVTVPFRSSPGTASGKIVWREIKVAILARLSQHLTRSGKTVTRVHQRRVVAVLGDISALEPRLQLEAFRQGIVHASQVVWISDGARGFWRLFQQSFADCAIGILDFYHAVGHLWRAADAYGQNNGRTPQQWFQRLRHQLRHGYVHRIIKELSYLLQYRSTPESAKPVLLQVRDYLQTHFDHLQYRSFKRMGLPIGSGMVESTCKWLIQQRFKGVGMRWSEAGFNHLLHLRLAWANHRFDTLFADHSLAPTLHSPNL